MPPFRSYIYARPVHLSNHNPAGKPQRHRRSTLANGGHTCYRREPGREDFAAGRASRQNKRPEPSGVWAL